MTQSQQYNQQKEEMADRYREMDAIDDVLFDLKALYKIHPLHAEELEDLIEQIDEYVQYDESLEYILSQIPDNIKALYMKS
tara:strand:+ start:247 stop:489 length:243 start_codon:yes stop_codon:yes gene_type:complete